MKNSNFRKPGLVSSILLALAALAGASASARAGETAIVVLRPGVDPLAVARNLGVRPRYVYHYALNGFAAELPPAGRTVLGVDARVLRVERDSPVSAAEAERDVPWGLDRIDQRSLPLDNIYHFRYTGSGVTAYVIDTGIRYDHDEFDGRASIGYDAFDEDAVDCNGHGTHVAATLGGKRFGVAKGVRLVSVRVLNCAGRGSMSAMLAGVDWVTGHHDRPAVANLSLISSPSRTLDDAVRAMIASGVATAVAAGNANDDACDYSPARVSEAMTTGSSTANDVKSGSSNWGACVAWFAPGNRILSAGIASRGAAIYMSGTSMASPHTAGVAALYLEHHPNASPAQVRAALLRQATRDVVSNARSRNDHLLFSLGDERGP